MAQLFAVVDDSYGFGNDGMVGMVSGIGAIIGASLMKKRPLIASLLLIVTAITGFYGLSVFYIIPGIATFGVGIYLLVKRNK
ncbi:hypothetical protein [Terribacillus halophilus]|uniref:hypothetical protein n=1 Tax=Terribacillus halophilus TaxID=361279 RepID=UPI00098716EE|nr:hypothetical protein [Terribacillus halophilus]